MTAPRETGPPSGATPAPRSDPAADGSADVKPAAVSTEPMKLFADAVDAASQRYVERMTEMTEAFVQFFEGIPDDNS